MTFPLRRHDGSFRPFLTRMVPIRDEHGAIDRGSPPTPTSPNCGPPNRPCATSTQPWKQVAERTAERDQIWQASTDLLCVANHDGYIVSLNPAWAATLGWDVRRDEGASLHRVRPSR